MKKLVLSIAMMTAIIATGLFPAAAQKTREVNIYLVKTVEKNGVSEESLIEVKRRVKTRTPLAGAIKALLAGATKAEDSLKDVNNGLVFVSARVRNDRVRIDLTYEKAKYRNDSEEYQWGATTREFFPKAIEKTTLQFPEIKKVLVCVDGIENYTIEDEFYHKKCPKNW